MADRRMTHGLTVAYHTPARNTVYAAWDSAKQRTTNPRHQRWDAYGGRGIRMWDQWLHDPAAFVRYMGPRPVGKWLDRMDNDGDYEPGNLRWATPSESALNRRNRWRTR